MRVYCIFTDDHDLLQITQDEPTPSYLLELEDESGQSVYVEEYPLRDADGNETL